MRVIFAVLNIILLPLSLQAAEVVNFELTPSATSVKLADRFYVRAGIDIPSGFETVVPDTATLDDSSFDFIKFLSSGTAVSGDRKTVEYIIEAQAFSLGVSTFPAINWKLEDKGGSVSQQARSPSFNIFVKELFPKNDGKIKEIYGPESFFSWLKTLLLILLVLGIMFIIYNRFLRRGLKKKLRRVSGWTDGRTPYQRATQCVERLEKTDLLARGRKSAFYFGLTSIFRRYFAEELGVDAVQMTTADLIRELKRTEIEQPVIAKIRLFMNGADAVKFAKAEPDDTAGDVSRLKELLAACNSAVGRQKEAAEAAASAERNGKVK